MSRVMKQSKGDVWGVPTIKYICRRDRPYWIVAGGVERDIFKHDSLSDNQ